MPRLTFALALVSGWAFVAKVVVPDVFVPDVSVLDVLVLGVVVLGAFAVDVFLLGVFATWAVEELELPLFSAEALVGACCADGGGLAGAFVAEFAAT